VVSIKSVESYFWVLRRIPPAIFLEVLKVCLFLSLFDKETEYLTNKILSATTNQKFVRCKMCIRLHGGVIANAVLINLYIYVWGNKEAAVGRVSELLL